DHCRHVALACSVVQCRQPAGATHRAVEPDDTAVQRVDFLGDRTLRGRRLQHHLTPGFNGLLNLRRREWTLRLRTLGSSAAATTTAEALSTALRGGRIGRCLRRGNDRRVTQVLLRLE